MYYQRRAGISVISQEFCQVNLFQALNSKQPRSELLWWIMSATAAGRLRGRKHPPPQPCRD